LILSERNERETGTTSGKSIKEKGKKDAPYQKQSILLLSGGALT